MTTRPPRFTAIPDVPQQGLGHGQFAALNAMKENIELLIGARGKNAISAAAITRGSVTVPNAPVQSMQRVTAEGVGFTISNVTVAGLDDFARLISNVQHLANDVAVLRNTVNTLIGQLKG